jgi:hypothetical protein
MIGSEELSRHGPKLEIYNSLKQTAPAGPLIDRRRSGLLPDIC